MTQSATFEARLRQMEDIQAINAVFDRWHFVCTGGFAGKQAGRMEALECLTDDATIELHGMHEPGKGPRGREQCAKFWAYFVGDDGPLPYVFQTMVGPQVVVNGDTATQQHNMLGIFQLRGAKATMGLSQRFNDLVRTPEGWRIKKTTVIGGMSFEIDNLKGALNALLPLEPRRPWTYEGARSGAS
jgi:hypothetical protein